MTEISNNKKTLTLKFEYDRKQYELSSLTTTDTIGDLRAVICSMLNIDDFNRINLKTLQPTKIIDTTDATRKLDEVFSQTRERIVVEEIGAAGTSKVEPLASRSDNPKEFPVSSQNQQLQKPKSSSLNQLSEKDFPTQLNNDYPVCSSTGYLLRHPVPSNNSCLFISIHFCLTQGIVDDGIGKSMRKIIAETVASDKERFDDAFLGKSNKDYCDWILDDNHWGGAIELSILSKYYEVEIVAVDVKNIILNRFGEDSHYQKRMLLLYDGLHYDPLKFQPLDDNQAVQTLFSTDNLELLTMAEELAKEAKQSHQFTDMNQLTMRCETCNAEFDAKNASEHASKTGHVQFVEKER